MLAETNIPKTIFASQSKVNGALPDYRFSIGTNSIWRYLGRQSSWRSGSGDFLLVGGRPQRSDTLELAERAPPVQEGGDQDFELIYNYSFVVTDGTNNYTVAVNDADPKHEANDGARQDRHILTFTGEIPPPDTDLRVVDPVVRKVNTNIHKDPRARIICFTPGTWIRTPTGPVSVEHLTVDDQVLTKDNGVQSIRWIGTRRITGARLIAMPDMRPVRIRKNALGANVPDRDMWVSPRHRMALSGPVAQELFNTPEVLVAAKDLVNDRTVTVDYQIKKTTYIHLLFDRHEVIWANGAETESFHPSHALATAVPSKQLAELYQIFPHIEDDPYSFGEPARRLLSEHEAALLLFA